MHKSTSIRTSLFGLCTALVFAACMPLAHATAITYGTLNFTVTNGSPVPTGTFVWNDTTNTWNSFTVNWDGAVYNFLGNAAVGLGTLSDMGTSGTWCGAAPDAPGDRCPPALFQLFGPGAVAVTLPENGSFSNPSAAADGSYTITETSAVPVSEPGSLGMLLLGLAAWGFGISWRRLPRGRHAAKTG